MKKILSYALSLLLCLAALSSCSKAFDVEMDMGEVNNERSIYITGAVTDSDTGELLENIQIEFNAYLQADLDSPAVISDAVFTNSNGIFTIYCEGSESKLTCTLVAEDPEGLYKSQTKQILVSWSGTSFDKDNNTFVVNDCSFNLKKEE